MEDLILEMRGITKRFPGVKALDNVNLKIEKGEIHSLVGENGAGKSTLMNILSGVYTFGNFEGEIYFDGEICKFKEIKESEEKGIAIIHQELALIPYLTIAENCFLGNERKRNGVIDWNKTTTECTKALERVNLKESPNTLVKDISIGKQQLLEIAKALSKDVKLLILDEPTAALNEEDSQHLLKLLLELKKSGITSILISHKINEVSKVSDKITIIRDGQVIETLENKKNVVSEDRIIRGMVGRTLTNRFPIRETIPSEEVSLEVKSWNVYDENDCKCKVIDNVSFYARKGEVIGFAGLMGAGRTELMMSIFGKSWGSNISGQLIKDGKEVEINSVSDAINNGIACVTEDRKSMGLILIDNISQNISLPNLKQFVKRNVINGDKEVKTTQDYSKKLNIKSTSVFQCVGNLSGGNQQKVVLAKWILANPDILILDEPTRGIDVGAKYEIYSIINKLVGEGKTIIMVSSELPEVLGMSDRIYVMNNGRITGELEQQVATQENIMKCIMNSRSTEE